MLQFTILSVVIQVNHSKLRDIVCNRFATCLLTTNDVNFLYIFINNTERALYDVKEINTKVNPSLPTASQVASYIRLTPHHMAS